MKFKKIKQKFNKSMKEKWYRQNFIVVCIAVFLLSFMSIGYAALSRNLDITGQINIAVQEEIRIIDIKSNIVDCGGDLFEPRNYVDSIVVNLNLPALNCTIEYIITIRNTTTSAKQLVNVVNESYNNDDIIYEFTNFGIEDVIESGDTVQATITFRYDPELTSLPSNTELGAIIRFIWEDYDPVIQLDVVLSRNMFLINENINIKDHLTVTRIRNGVPTVLAPDQYEVVGFSTSTAVTDGVLTIVYGSVETTRTYTIRALGGSLVPGNVSIAYVVYPHQINITITFSGQIQQFWYFYSEDVEDMFLPQAQMQPRLTGTGTAGSRVVNAPLDAYGNLRSGYYYVYAQRNGNLHDAYVIIKID